MSGFRKANNWLHKWMGLITGIVVFIVCITGCIWVFQDEIKSLLHPEYNVDYQNKPVLTPKEIQELTHAVFPNDPIKNAYYLQGKAIHIKVGKGRKGNKSLHLNPYNGSVISKTEGEAEFDFFRFILNGHRFLWLPYEAGRIIVNYSVLIFVFILISGLVWWYPKKWNKSTVKKSFKIKWKSKWKRFTIDLHNVLGFYALLFLLAIALTGMVWGIQWFSEGLYWVTSAGEELPEWNSVGSDTTHTKATGYDDAITIIWDKVVEANPKAEGFYFMYPDTSDAQSTFGVIIYPTATEIYKNQRYTFDRHSLARLSVFELYETPFEKLSFAGKLRKMNYDIHVGSILGFPGKCLAFLASLIGASLPVTGTIIWLSRKKKKPVKNKQIPVNTKTINPGKIKVKSIVKQKEKFELYEN